jgi:pyruvate formate lyase activating enzyme
MKLPVFAETFGAELDAGSLVGDLWTPAEDGSVRCVACAHRCVVAQGSRGACGVRFNRDGALRVPFGYVARRYVRPVETNTIFHVLPGAQALTFGMYGCDLRCPYCHNHRLSQALRDGPTQEHPTSMSAEALVDEALSAGCRVLCAAYNEPMLSVEWMTRVFEVARARGLVTAVVSDGHSTPEALRYLRPAADVFRVDLKAHDEPSYKKLGGRLQPVLDSIALARELGYWVEVVTLVVPGLNQEARAIASLGARLRDIDPCIPWHLNGFVPRYRLAQEPPADPLFLLMAAGSAYAQGSRFVYVGNAPACAELAHTRCPECHSVVIRRHDYATLENQLQAGACSRCGTALPGLWASRGPAPAPAPGRS